MHKKKATRLEPCFGEKAISSEHDDVKSCRTSRALTYLIANRPLHGHKALALLKDKERLTGLGEFIIISAALRPPSKSPSSHDSELRGKL